MSERKRLTETPPPLAGDPQLGPLLECAKAEFRQGLDEATAFRRLSERLREEREEGGGPRRRGLRLAGIASADGVSLAAAPLAALCLALLWFGVVHYGERVASNGTAPVQAPPVGVAPASALPAPEPQAEISAEPVPVPVQPAETSAPLASGRSRFPDGTIAAVGKRAVARVRAVQRTTKVLLEHGDIELVVAKQDAGNRFEVEGGNYRFEVLGTVFRVAYEQSGEVSLEVREGSVAVWQGRRLIKRVAAGEKWQSPASASDARLSTAPRPALEPPRAPDCLGLARDGHAEQAERCFAERAAGAGLGAEMALYELARLRRDVLGDANGALSALGEYAARFPRGSLRHEVAVFRVELLARLGRAPEALAHSQALLDSESGRERAAELHLLRGNVYRQTLNDTAAAEGEYRAAEKFGAAAGAQATYLRALCLEALGDAAGARAAFERYLSVPGRPQREAAQRRLEQLSRLGPPKEALP